MKNILLCFLLAVVQLSISTLLAQPFVHPGGLHNKADLERIKYMVQVGAHPWIDSYNTLNANSKSSYNYVVQGDSTLTVVTRDAPSTNLSKWYSDANAAYYNALMYAITGDTRHADKCVQIFKAWSNLTQVTGGGTESLNGGLLGFLMIEAAEIIQSTYPAWDSASKQKFKNMLVYPGYSTTTVPPTLSATNGTFYWRIYLGDPGRHGNQDLAGIRTMLSMGVFLDNRTMYNRALRYYEGLPHQSGDFPFASGPSTATSLVSSTSYSDTYNFTEGTTIPDYGYNGVLTNYFWANGQCQESSRDQGHTSLGGSLCQCISEIAWHQGDDAYSLTNNRLLLGLNYMTKYNVSYITSYTDQLIPWEPTAASGEYTQAFDRTHRWFSRRVNPWSDADTLTLTRGYNSIIPPVWEMGVAHYTVRQGLSSDSVKWITRARDQSIDSVGYESHAPGTTDADHPGYGALTCRRPDGCAGDPVNGFSSGKPLFEMNVLPGTIEAENFDYYSDSGRGEGHSYHDLSKGNSGGQYRTDADVDIKVCSEGGYNLTSLESGEWITYTVFVPTAGNYNINIRYASASGNGKIKFSFGGVDKTAEVAVPFGTGFSTSLTDWETYTVASSVLLSAGVQSMRIWITGTSNSFELNNISFSTAAVTLGDYRSHQSGGWSGNAIGTAVITSGALTGINITAGGQGYGTTAPAITFNNSSGSPAATAVLTSGAVTGATITAGGSGNTAGTAVLFGLPAAAADQAANWETYNGTAWVTATVLPAATNNVTIQAGHTVTISNATANCKNLTIQAGATVNSPNYSGGNVQTLIVKGNIIVNGVLGNTATTYGTIGDGLRVYIDATDTTTITGTGVANIGGLQVNNNNANAQAIIIDMDMVLRRNSSGNSTALTLTSGTNGTATKTFTINPGKTVTLGAGGFHGTQGSTTAPTGTGGNITYTVNGTLDVSAGQFNLYSTSATASSTQQVKVIVGANGVLKLGSIVRLSRTQSTQLVNVSVLAGGSVDASGIAMDLVNSVNVASGAYSWFSLAPGATFSRLVTAGVATPLWIGTTTSYNPVTLTPATTSVFPVSVATGNTPTGLSDPTKAINRTWIINPAITSATNITFGYNGTTTGTGDANANCNPAASMGLLYYNGTSWSSIATATPVTGTGTDKAVSYTGVSSFSTFCIGNANTVLPLSLLSFNASLVSSKVSLAWSTSNEINVHDFVIERSIDGSAFNAIGTVAADNQAAVNEYSFTDAVPHTGVNYYRINITDNDGAVKLSSVAAIAINHRKPIALMAYPNPAINNVTISHSKAEGASYISVLTEDGRQVVLVTVARDAIQTSLDVSKLPAGKYILTYHDQTAVSSIVLVK